MVVELQQGRSEDNYARPEMYSVIIHHAVSGCFTCRKITCFNLPSFQTHIYYAKRYSGWHYRAHHCSSSLLKGVFFRVSQSLPHQVYARHPLSEKRFKVFLSQRRGSCYSLFLLICCSHTEILVPSCSHTRLCPSLPFSCAADPVSSFSAEK